MAVSETIGHEAVLFGISILVGAGLFLFYDSLRIFRRILPHGNIAIGVGLFLLAGVHGDGLCHALPGKRRQGARVCAAWSWNRYAALLPAVEPLYYFHSCAGTQKGAVVFAEGIWKIVRTRTARREKRRTIFEKGIEKAVKSG